MYDEVIFDLETKKLFSDINGNNPADLGVSIVSLYKRVLDENLNETEGELQSFWEHDFDKMWPVFQDVDRIIGFNSLGFDVPVLKPYEPFPFIKLPHFDIMQKLKEVFGRRISLDAIAKETLDREKKETGLEAVWYWQKGDKESLKKLKEYCEDDVKLTRDVYDYVLKEGHVLFNDKWNNLKKVKLDFSYPKDASKKQIGLF